MIAEVLIQRHDDEHAINVGGEDLRSRLCARTFPRDGGSSIEDGLNRGLIAFALDHDEVADRDGEVPIFAQRAAHETHEFRASVVNEQAVSEMRDDACGSECGVCYLRLEEWCPAV